jgi:transposase
VWKRVVQHLAADAGTEYAMIDSTIVRAHQHSAGAKKAGKDQARSLGDRGVDRVPKSTP